MRERWLCKVADVEVGCSVRLQGAVVTEPRTSFFNFLERAGG
jgi:hypothetical protein